MAFLLLWPAAVEATGAFRLFFCKFKTRLHPRMSLQHHTGHEHCSRTCDTDCAWVFSMTSYIFRLVGDTVFKFTPSVWSGDVKRLLPGGLLFTPLIYSGCIPLAGEAEAAVATLTISSSA